MDIGRPRKLDPEVALESAMEAFWLKGYEATSMNDLVKATGLLKGSLYQTFGDKHRLFCLSLSHYLDTLYKDHKTHLLSHDDFKLCLRNALSEMIDLTISSDGQKRGCMAVNSLVESSPHDDKVASILMLHYQKVISLFSSVIDKATESNQVKPVFDSEQCTFSIMTFMTGLTVSSKGPLEQRQAVELLEMHLTLLRL